MQTQGMDFFHFFVLAFAFEFSTCEPVKTQMQMIFFFMICRHGTNAIIEEMRKALEFVPCPKRTITRKQHARKYQVARLGGDRLGRNTFTHTSYLANKGALFMQPHRAIPPYFVIHPELP